MQVNSVQGVKNQENKLFDSRKKGINDLKGMTAAIALGSFIPVLQAPIANFCLDKMVKINKTLSEDEVEFVNQGAQKTLEELTNLHKKGVKIINHDRIKPKKQNKNISNWFKRDIFSEIANGRNAAFIITNNSKSNNSIVVNKNKFPLSIFHEMGHAFNFHNSKAWKKIQSFRNPILNTILWTPVMLAFTEKEVPQEGKELTAEQKIKNKMRNATPIIAMGASLFINSEEIMASIRANKWAEKIFKNNPEIAKKVSKVNQYGALTYFALTALIGIACASVIKIRDYFTDKNIENSKIANEKKAHQGFFPDKIKTNAHQG